MPKSRWGLTVPLPGITLVEHEHAYREAEALGYTDFWSAETDADAVIPIALAAAWTRTVTLGTAILGAFIRGPALLAMTAAALGEAAPGRFCLGIGAGSNVNVERWNGVRFERPRTRVAEVVRAVRQALDGEPMNVEGQTLKVAGFRLGRRAPYRVPIYVAALQEQMLRQAVRIADGVVLTWVAADDVPRIRAVVRDEAVRCGKDPDAVPLVCRINVSPSTDPRVREGYRRSVTAYLNVPVYRRYHEWLGRGEALAPMQRAWDAGDRRAALAAVPERVIDELGVFGTPAQCLAHIRRFVDNGVTVPVLNFVNVETDPAAQARASLDMLRALAPVT